MTQDQRKTFWDTNLKPEDRLRLAAEALNVTKVAPEEENERRHLNNEGKSVNEWKRKFVGEKMWTKNGMNQLGKLIMEFGDADRKAKALLQIQLLKFKLALSICKIKLWNSLLHDSVFVYLYAPKVVRLLRGCSIEASVHQLHR